VEDVESCASDEEINDEEEEQPASTQEEETQDEAKRFHFKKSQKQIEEDVEEVPPPAKRKCDDDEDDTPENEPRRCSERIASHSSPQIPQGSRSSQQSVSRQRNTRSGATESYEYSPVEYVPHSPKVGSNSYSFTQDFSEKVPSPSETEYADFDRQDFLSPLDDEFQFAPSTVPVLLYLFPCRHLLTFPSESLSI
jgi:hypothetical protein